MFIDFKVTIQIIVFVLFIVVLYIVIEWNIFKKEPNTYFSLKKEKQISLNIRYRRKQIANKRSHTFSTHKTFVINVLTKPST